jgi:hypothetical protein
LNCDLLRWDPVEIVAALDRGELTYESLLYEMAVARRVSAVIDPSWNSLERYVAGETALLHYTDMPTQPWVSRDNPLGYLWVRDLLAAVDEGFITREYVDGQIGNGVVRPSLRYQLEHRVEDARKLPDAAKALDATFVAPYRRMGNGGPAKGALQLVKSVLKRLTHARNG